MSKLARFRTFLHVSREDKEGAKVHVYGDYPFEGHRVLMRN